ncbi:MAG: hypothetical protein HY673_19685 [Chloroflexi bacterium]|nr:hypothetical protein [Chloroflexota bacterium]
MKKARIGIYLEDEEMAKQVKIAAAKRRTSVSRYCGRAIEERLVKDRERAPVERSGEISKEKLAFLARMDRRSKRIGPIGVSAAELVREGRRR